MAERFKLHNVFVSVGSTRFDDLISALASQSVIQALRSVGCENLVVQAGGSCKETLLADHFKSVQMFDYKPSLEQHFSAANLVISHAGAGTTLEALRKGKLLLVVVNEFLMDNHQFEMAKHLANENYLYYCTVSTLAESIMALNRRTLSTFPAQNPKLFSDFLDDAVKHLVD